MSQGGWCAENLPSNEPVASDDAGNTLTTPRGGWCTEPVSFNGDTSTSTAFAEPTTDFAAAEASTVAPITPSPPVLATQDAALISAPTTASIISAPYATAAGDNSKRENAPSKRGQAEEQLSMFKGQQVHRVGYARDVWALGKQEGNQAGLALR